MNGRLIVESSVPIASVCARSCAELSTCGISSMGKYWVSTLLCSLGSKGARILRRPSQLTPWKNGWFFNSCAPPTRPRRFAESQIRLHQDQYEVISLQTSKNVPSDEMLGLRSQLLIRWEAQVSRPVDNLTVRVVRLLGAERWPSDQTLKHDCANTPPITAKVISFAAEDLGCNVIRCTDSGVGQLSPRFTPCVYLGTVRYSKLNLVE